MKSTLSAVLLFPLLMAGCVHPRVRTDRGESLRLFEVKASPALVERGRYIANHVAACMDCHSQRDWTRLAGPILPGTLGAGGQEYGKNYGLPGRFYGRNLTPAALGNWSDGEILRAITAGVNREGKPLFPLMPFRNYHQMRLTDATAIIAYLRSLKPIPNNVPPAQTSAPVRLVMRMMPHRARLRTDTASLSDVARGQYLAQLAGCADCHTARTMGNLIQKAPFAGGMVLRINGGTLRSANITPDNETGIGRWSRQDFISRFRAHDPASHPAPVVDGGFNTVMPWSLYAGMTDTDLGAIYAYLQTLRPVRNRVMVFSAGK